MENQWSEVKEGAATHKKCRIRKDLIEQELSVPVGDSYYFSKDSIPYKWIEDNRFQVFLDDKWQDAYSIDFDFH